MEQIFYIRVNMGNYLLNKISIPHAAHAVIAFIAYCSAHKLKCHLWQMNFGRRYLNSGRSTFLKGATACVQTAREERDRRM